MEVHTPVAVKNDHIPPAFYLSNPSPPQVPSSSTPTASSNTNFSGRPSPASESSPYGESKKEVIRYSSGKVEHDNEYLTKHIPFFESAIPSHTSVFEAHLPKTTSTSLPTTPQPTTSKLISMPPRKSLSPVITHDGALETHFKNIPDTFISHSPFSKMNALLKTEYNDSYNDSMSLLHSTVKPTVKSKPLSHDDIDVRLSTPIKEKKAVGRPKNKNPTEKQLRQQGYDETRKNKVFVNAGKEVSHSNK